MDQAKQTKETAPAALPAPVATGQRDLFVYFTLVLVAAALGFGLNLHFDAAPAVAAGFAALATLVLLLAHKLHRRGQTIAALRRECADLAARSVDSRRAAPQARGPRETVTPGAVPGAAGAAVAGAPGTGLRPGPLPAPNAAGQSNYPRPLQTVAPQNGQNSQNAALTQRNAQPASQSQPFPNSHSAQSNQSALAWPLPPVPAQPTPPGSAQLAGATHASPAGLARPMPPAAPALSGNTATAPAFPPPLPSGEPNIAVRNDLAALRRRDPYELGVSGYPGAHPAVPPSPSGQQSQIVRSAAPPGSVYAGPVLDAHAADPLMGGYGGHRPGVQREPVLTDPMAQADAREPSGPTLAEPTASAPPALSTLRLAGAAPGVGASASAESHISARAHIKPAITHLPPIDLDSGPGERELETMQNLIQQLAAQLNFARPADDAVKPALPVNALENTLASGPTAEPVTGQASDEASLRQDTPPTTATPAEADLAASSDFGLRQSVAALRATASTMRHAFPEPSATSSEVVDLKPAAAVAPASAPATSPDSPPNAEAPPKPTQELAPEPSPEPLSPYAQIARVTEAIAAERIDLYLDPILGLSDRKARLFEVSIRLLGSDGEAFDLDLFRGIAAGSGLLARIDSAKLARSAQVADRLRARGTNAALLTNLAAESLADDVFLDTFEEVVALPGDVPKRLVLAFKQSDVRAFNEVHWETVATMADLGFRFALEDVADLDLDFEKLKSHGFEFVKLDARVFLDGLPAADGAIPAPDLCRHLSDLGLALIVGRIEDNVILAKVLGFGVLFGQGTIFGGPRAVKVDVPAPAARQVAAA